MTSAVDLVVIGAGPAGAEAAATAAEHGLGVVVLDEASSAGGQVYRMPTSGMEAAAAPEGTAMRQRLEQSGARFLAGTVVWNIARHSGDDGSPYFELSLAGPGVDSSDLRARRVIVASGATERFYARPGWTVPGVFGLGAATVLIKSFGVLPGQRVVLAGAGPLLSLAAHLIIDAGGTVAAIADVNPLSMWLRLLPAMASRPDLLARGLGWQLELLSHRVPVYREHDIERISGDKFVTGASLRSLDGRRTVEVKADAVCMGYGLVPSTEIYRLLGARQDYIPEHGGWVPTLDPNQRTSVPGLYGVGDGARLLGAAAAPLQGRLAALAVMEDLGKTGPQRSSDDMSKVKNQLKRAAKFGGAMAELCMPRAQAMQEVPDDTVVCRCEDVLAGTIRAAISEGARTLDSLKSTTRCGMGPCGGRSCSPSAAALLECVGGSRPADIAQPSSRPPLRPISLSAVAGEFAYADIPFPEPSPV